MTEIFLSYARGDDEPFVGHLYDDLTASGFTVWYDRVAMPSRALTFLQEIRDAIAAADRLLLVVGPVQRLAPLHGGPTSTPTPYPPSLRQGLVINEVCSSPVTTDNVPDGVISGDSAVELFNSSSEPLDLSPYRLCVNTTCLWLEGTIQPLGYKVWYQQWDGLSFTEGGANTVRLYRAGESPLILVDTLAVQSQTADHCWAAVTDASPVYVQKYPPTLGRGNNWFE